MFMGLVHVEGYDEEKLIICYDLRDWKDLCYHVWPCWERLGIICPEGHT
jgi:hypothetical protein